MINFEHEYLIFDEFGPKEILCMSCAKPIKSRTEIKSIKHPGFIIREISKHPEYREIPVTLSDGNISFIMVCDDCKFVNIGKEEAFRITHQIKSALAAQLKWEGKENDLIGEILFQNQRSVIRRSETSEVSKALKGII